MTITKYTFEKNMIDFSKSNDLEKFPIYNTLDKVIFSIVLNDGEEMKTEDLYGIITYLYRNQEPDDELLDKVIQLNRVFERYKNEFDEETPIYQFLDIYLSYLEKYIEYINDKDSQYNPLTEAEDDEDQSQETDQTGDTQDSEDSEEETENESETVEDAEEDSGAEEEENQSEEDYGEEEDNESQNDEEQEEGNSSDPIDLYIRREYFRSFIDILSNIDKFEEKMDDFKSNYPEIENIHFINNLSEANEKTKEIIKGIIYSKVINDIEIDRLKKVHRHIVSLIQKEINNFHKYVKKVIKIQNKK